MKTFMEYIKHLKRIKFENGSKKMKTNISILSILLLFTTIHIAGAESIADQVNSFNHVSITVKDLNRSIDFYKNVIGCKELPGGGLRKGKELSEGVGIKGAELDNYKLQFPNSNTLLELIKFRNVKQKLGNNNLIDITGITHFCLMVKDVDVTYKILKANHVKCISPPVTVKQTGAKFFYAYDPDGNIIEIVQGK